jgi:RNA polymerase sigma-70 factor, ECF subfamily
MVPSAPHRCGRSRAAGGRPDCALCLERAIGCHKRTGLFHFLIVDQGEQQAKQAFLELYDRLERRLLKYLVRRAPDVEIAAEIWAESWAIAFENWQRRRGQDPGSSEAWVFGIARHQLAAYYRSESIERRALERLRWAVPSVDGALHDELERIVDRDAPRSDVADAMQGLSAERRNAVHLRIVEGRNYCDIAASLGCSEQTARAHVSRGLRRLARALERQNSQPPSEVTPQ